MALNAKLTSAEANIGLYLSGVSERPLPGIVLLHEIFGVNHAMEIAADGFARAGFVVRRRCARSLSCVRAGNGAQLSGR